MVFGLGKLFGSKGREARAMAARMENRDLLEAIIAGSVLVAAADGELEASELDKIDKLLKTNKQLEHFGTEIPKLLNQFKEQFLEGGIRIIRMNAMREIEDLKHTPKDAETVLNTLLTVAEADGTIEPEEEVILDKIATVLGLRLKDYL